ncbi:lysophospholipase plb1 [Grosmannia clavigera kw1407]|uniref:Lysophospholipase n=1 Tax=Grosmannia clavigera (strain kw1407 / UAMH 11150) TaxID=655863 RepID=F0XDH0_GROCL|nr:lysophospholipase plb1 [Grosmannia clavigera kw1407]EFX04741.1 lysophospholipase plb1 [Grosmannia clavigera kw1407]
MVLLSLLVGAVALAPTALAAAPTELTDALYGRALPNNPSGNYTPIYVDCPAARPAARVASALSTNETEWLALRRKNTRQPLVDFLVAANITGFNATSYVAAASTRNVPNIGLAMSGGGYRALMNGAGFLAAADSRTTDLPASNVSIGGLLQASTYLAGLSGGGWLVGSMFANNFSTIVELRDGYVGSDLWRFDNSIFSGPSDDAQNSGSTQTTSTSTRRRAIEAIRHIARRDGVQLDLDNDDTAPKTAQHLHIIDTAEYWTHVADQVAGKADAGFQTSLTDYWGRALSYQLINAPYGGVDYTFSSIALADNFIAGQTPFPILVADGRAPNTTIISLNATLYEFNAFEMGSWDPTTYGFVPTEYLGSNFTNGVVPTGNDSHCVRGFDQFGYIMGTSSTLFNQFLLTNLSTEINVPSFVIKVIDHILEDLGNDNNDIAQYVPNPFYKYHPETNAAAEDIQLSLVDGGEDLENLPLHPLIQPFRQVDVIVAVDSSADTDYNWPNGTALRASYDRSLGDISNGTLFPAVPDDNTFVNLGLNKRPTFFGCNASNFTLTDGQTVPPLVVYLPNAPYSVDSNVSTFTDSYTLTLRNKIITNGFNAATQGNGTVNADWTTCLACAVLSRSFTRTNTSVPAACTTCFAKYCWNGTLNTTNYGAYEPTFLLANVSSAAVRGLPAAGSTMRTLAAASLSSLLAFLLL